MFLPQLVGGAAWVYELQSCGSRSIDKHLLLTTHTLIPDKARGRLLPTV
jgi:hypothetical protein